jgi:oligoendopeptidase F
MRLRMKIQHTTWNLKHLATGDNDPAFATKREAITTAANAFVKKWKKRTDYLEDPAVLLRALDEYERLHREHEPAGDEYIYFRHRQSQNADDSKVKARLGKAQEFVENIYNDLRFFSLNVAKIPAAKQKKFLVYPGLRKYKHYLQGHFLAAQYHLSDAEEKIISLKNNGPAYNNWKSMVDAFLAREEGETLGPDGKKATRGLEELLNLSSDPKPAVRDAAAAAINDIFKKNLPVAEAEMNSILQNKKIDDELRGFVRPDSAQHLDDDIDTDVVDALIEAVSKRNDIAKKIYQFKAKLLGIEKFKYHERNLKYGAVNATYSYQQAVDMVEKVYSKLDSDFASLFREAVEGGYIDVYPRKGKHGGAFCAGGAYHQHSYILLNYTNQLRDIMTLAHEMGHAINDELTRHAQNALNTGTPLSTAEVASTFMEQFVADEVMAEADDEMRLALMVEELNNNVAGIFRQTAAYRFEQELHGRFREQGHVSKEDIGRIFKKHMAAYMGSVVEQSEGSENWWVHWGHFRAPFYVYSYVSGHLIAKSLHAAVKKDPSFIVKVKEFLSAGLSDSPKNIFAKLGIDIASVEFWQAGLKEIEDTLKEAQKLAKKLGKI